MWRIRFADWWFGLAVGAMSVFSAVFTTLLSLLVLLFIIIVTIIIIIIIIIAYCVYAFANK